MLQANLRLSLILVQNKFKLIFNSLQSRASAGKLLAGVIGVIATFLVITSASSELIQSLRQIPFAELIIDWILAMLLVYCLFIVLTGDLLTGHTLGSGQMSQDFAYLTTLPVPPICIIVVKLFERMATDYLGLLILLSAFLGLTCRDGFTLSGILVATILYIQMSLAIGLLINLIMVFLQRFFRTATINNFFSLLGYVSAFSTLIPYLIFANYTMDSLNWVFNNYTWLNSTIFRVILPMRWAAVTLINKTFCPEFFYFSLFWATIMVIGISFFYAAIKLNWLTYSHSAAKRSSKAGKSFFTGFMRKEMLLIKSDLNIAVNAVLMPLTIILVEIYFLKQIFNFDTASSVLNFIYGAIIYFCMFGPMNAIGSEGKAVSFLETLPLHPAQILLRKLLCWQTVALTIFIPAVTATMVYLNFSSGMVVHAILASALFSAACIWVTISISAIFARYDSKVLQQRSSLTGKFTALGLMLLAAPMKDVSLLNIYNAIIFACIGTLVFMKACNAFYYRIDMEMRNSAQVKRIDFLLILFIFAGIEAGIRQFFLAVIPTVDTGLWSWVMPMFLLAPALILQLFGKTRDGRQRPNRQTDENEKSEFEISAYIKIFSLTAATAILTFGLPEFLPQATSIFKENAREFIYLTDRIMAIFEFRFSDIPLVFGLTAGELISISGIYALTILSSCAIIYLLTSRFANRKNGHGYLLTALGAMAPALIAPLVLVVPIVLYCLVLLSITAASSSGQKMAVFSTGLLAAAITSWALFL